MAASHRSCPVTLQDISSKAQLEKFVQSQPENVLTVVNVSSNNATPCVRVFPAVMALAKNFTGYAAFARLLYETSQETQSLANELRVLEVSLWAAASFERQSLFSDRLLHELPMVPLAHYTAHPCRHVVCDAMYQHQHSTAIAQGPNCLQNVCRYRHSSSTAMERRWGGMWDPQGGTSLERSWSSKLLWELLLRLRQSPPQGAAPARMHDGLAVLCQTCPQQQPLV